MKPTLIYNYPDVYKEHEELAGRVKDAVNDYNKKNPDSLSEHIDVNQNIMNTIKDYSNSSTRDFKTTADDKL
jgi:hypothetical protein